MSGMAEQLRAIRNKVPRGEDIEIVTNDLNEGTLEIKTPASTDKVTLSKAESNKIIKNTILMQQASILEKRLSAVANAGLAFLLFATGAGTVITMYNGSKVKKQEAT